MPGRSDRSEASLWVATIAVHTGVEEGRREGPMQGFGITLVVMIVAAGREDPPGAEPTRRRCGRRWAACPSWRARVRPGRRPGLRLLHHVPMMIWTHHEAEERGFTINKGAVEEAESWALGQYSSTPSSCPRARTRASQRGPGPGSVYLGLGVGAAGHKGGPAAEAGKFSDHFARIRRATAPGR